MKEKKILFIHKAKVNSLFQQQQQNKEKEKKRKRAMDGFGYGSETWSNIHLFIL